MTAPYKTSNRIIRQNVFRKKHKRRIKLWIQRYGQVLHMNGMIPSRVSQHKMAKREIMWNDWGSNLVWCRERSTGVGWYYVNTSGPHQCHCSVRNVTWTWAWLSMVTDLCILRVAVPVHMCMVAWACSKWSPKEVVYEHWVKRNQEPNHQIFDTAKCVSLDSTVGIVTSYRLHGHGFKSWQGQEIFLFLKPVHIGSGAHPASYSIGIRCSEKEVGLWDWPFTSSMCKTEWRYNSYSPPICLHGAESDGFTFARCVNEPDVLVTLHIPWSQESECPSKPKVANLDIYLSELYVNHLNPSGNCMHHPL